MKSITSGICILLLIPVSSASAKGVSINISASAEYEDERVIATNIRTECTQLGRQLSESTKKYMKKNGYTAVLKPDIKETDPGKNLIIKIVNAVSAGNAWTGHRKSVAMEAKLYQDGELIDTFSSARNSGGGFGGGFKGACSVLHRCANTLGSDISKWLKKKKIK